MTKKKWLLVGIGALLVVCVLCGIIVGTSDSEETKVEEAVAEEVTAMPTVVPEVIPTAIEEVIVEETEDTWEECGVEYYMEQYFGDEPFAYVGFSGDYASIYCHIFENNTELADAGMVAVYNNSLPDNRTKVCGTILSDGVYGNYYIIGNDSTALVFANAACEAMEWEN